MYVDPCLTKSCIDVDQTNTIGADDVSADTGAGTVTPVNPPDQNTSPTTPTTPTVIVEPVDAGAPNEESVGRPNLIDESYTEVVETESEPIIIELIEYVTIRVPAPV